METKYFPETKRIKIIMSFCLKTTIFDDDFFLLQLFALIQIVFEAVKQTKYHSIKHFKFNDINSLENAMDAHTASRNIEQCQTWMLNS